MKIIKMKGGLGNQMFQYAFFLANKNYCNNVKLDFSSYNDYYVHNGIELFEIFNIQNKDEFELQKNTKLKDEYKFFKFRKRIGFILGNRNLIIKDSHYIEKNYSEYSEGLLKNSNLYLDGYWQNEKYFNASRKLILKKYKWQTISEKNEKLAVDLKRSNSVSVHIRRYDKIKSIKDLFSFVKLILTYRIAPKSYYHKAISYINKFVDKPIFYIFTDDVKWVKRNIHIDDSYILVNWNRGLESNQDMFLMTQCKHNIISMSTFSWWGAWLNNNKNKIVIAPKKWAVRFEKDNGTIPNSWTRL